MSGGANQQQHNDNVLMNASLTQVALLPIMVMPIQKAAGYIVECVNIYSVMASDGLKSLDRVTLRQVLELQVFLYGIISLDDCCNFTTAGFIDYSLFGGLF